MNTLLLTFILLGAAIVLLGVKALFVKGGKFPSGHAHEIMAKRNPRRNRHMSEVTDNNKKHKKQTKRIVT